MTRKSYGILYVLILLIGYFNMLIAETPIKTFNLGNKNYHLINNKWYHFTKEKQGDEIVPNRLIIKLKDCSDPRHFDFSKFDIDDSKLAFEVIFDGYYVMQVDTTEDPFNIASLLKSCIAVDYIEFDALGKMNTPPNDEYYLDQWGLDKISITSAWGITKGVNSVICAIIDTGVDFDHDDLNNIWVNPGEDYNQNGQPDFYPATLGGDLDYVDNDGNDFADDLIGWDYCQLDNYPDDSNGHGTCVAGIIAAQINNNSEGIAGIAGGWDTNIGIRLMPLRYNYVLNPGYASTAQAITYARQNGAKVINISSSWEDDWDVLRFATMAAEDNGCIVVCSSGNNGGDESNDKSVQYPAKYPWTIAVGASKESDARWNTSDLEGYGSAYGQNLDVVAPGGVSTIISTFKNNGYYCTFGGTSAAAPIVSGIVSLILSINSSLTVEQVHNAIAGSCDKIGTYTYTVGAGELSELTWNNQVGYGRVNAFKALKYTLENYGGTLTQDIEVESGKSLDFTSSTIINLDSKSITVSGGTITIANGAEINPYICVKESGVIKGLYPNITEAAAATTAGQVIVLNGELDDNINVPSGETVVIESTADIDMNNKSITTTAGTISVINGANIDPDIRLKSGSSIVGLYPDLASAYSDGNSVEIRSNLTFNDNYTVTSGRTLKPMDGAQLKFPSGKYLNVYGTLSCDEVSFTSTSGTWGGIKYQSGSDGTLNEATITNATYGVYCKSTLADIRNSDISNCTYGIYCYNAGLNVISYNDISGSTYDIYCYDSSPRIRNNDISGGSISLYCDNSSSPELLTGTNTFHNNYVFFGVFADDGSNPELGFSDCCLPGNHSFVYGGYDLAIVHAGTNCHIYAQGNWWGTPSPSAGMFSGDVNWNDYRSSAPTQLAPNPEDELFDQHFNYTSVAPDEGNEELIKNYNDKWPLNLKIDFLKYLARNNEVLGIPTLCKNIIEENPYAPEAFQALDIIYQLAKREDIVKDINKESLMNYLKTFDSNLGNKMLNGSALLMLAGLEKENGLSRINAVYAANKDNYLGPYALYQKFMYYYHDAEDLDKAKQVLVLLDSEYPDDRVTFEAHLFIGDNEIDAKEFYANYSDEETSDINYVTSDIEDIIPEEYSLNPAFPNPFNPSTTLEFALPVQSEVECSIYNVRGNLVKEYSYEQNAGAYSIVWDASNVSSGIYLIRFVAEASDGSETFVDYQKVTLLK